MDDIRELPKRLPYDLVYYRAWAKRFRHRVEVGVDTAQQLLTTITPEYGEKFTLDECEGILAIIKNWEDGKATFPFAYHVSTQRNAIALILRTLAEHVVKGTETIHEIEDAKIALNNLATIPAYNPHA